MTYSNPATQGKKITIIFGVVLSVLVLLTINSVIDNDFWFLLKGGDYVMANGIPHTEPFTMHQGWNFVMQQWLSSVIFALIYNTFGVMGVLYAGPVSDGLAFLVSATLLIFERKRTVSTKKKEILPVTKRLLRRG